MSFFNVRKYTFLASGAIILLGVICFFIFGGLNFGLDFTSGTSLLIEIGQEFDNQEITDLVTGIVGENPMVQKTGSAGTQAMIRTKEIPTEERDQIFEAIQDRYGLEQEALLEATNVSASTSLRLFSDAGQAILYSLIFMLLYITIRFEFRSGVAAVANLVHNVLILLAVYTVTQLTVDSSFIAAILTIVGYSINDTIVIFDKIRENKKKERRLAFWQITDKSCMQTLTRSLYTSITTLMTIGVLYIVGVPSVKQFALPIIMGIIVGTYASIFIASPLWVILVDVLKPKRRKTA